MTITQFITGNPDQAFRHLITDLNMNTAFETARDRYETAEPHSTAHEINRTKWALLDMVIDGWFPNIVAPAEPETAPPTPGKWVRFGNKVMTGVGHRNKPIADCFVGWLTSSDKDHNAREFHISTAESNANAQLIATAPAMLESMKSVRSYFKYHVNMLMLDETHVEMIRELNETIKTATS